MKHKLLDFRNIMAATMLALMLCLGNSASAQPVLPVNQDALWYTSGNQIFGINSATIAYGASALLGASIFYDGTGTESLWLTDFINSPVSISTSLNPVASIPDIVIENDMRVGQHPHRDYLAAIAYVQSTSIVEVDVYAFSYTAGTFNPTPTPIYTMTISAGHSQTVHLCAIAEPFTIMPTGFPELQNCFITWDDASGPSVYVQEANLSLGSLIGTPQLISSNGYAPDVAHVSVGSAPVTHVAEIAYVDASGLALLEAEWVPGGAVLTTTLDAGASSNGISNPRIEAMDHIATLPGPGTPSYYKVVAQVLNTGTSQNEIRTYDNQLAATPTWFTSSSVDDLTALAGAYTFTAVPTSNYNSYLPTVACDGGNYMVSHFLNYGTSGSEILMMEPVAISTPTVIATPGSYYWANMTGSVTPTPTDADVCSYANAVCTPPNAQTAGSLFSWAFYNGSNYEVDYQLPLVASGVYTFTPVKNTEKVNTVAPIANWQLYPNPTTGVVSIANFTGSGAATGFVITDVLGRELMKGELMPGITAIDTKQLKAGLYVLRVFKGEEDEGRKTFVKE